MRAILFASAILTVSTALAQPGTNTRVSVSSLGDQSNGDSQFPTMSAGGRYVAFRSLASNLVLNDTNGVGDIFVHDCATGTTERVSVSSSGEQGDGECFGPKVTPDGRFVGFYSFSTNLVPDDTNGQRDGFVRDRLTGITERVSVSSSGEQGNGMTWDVSPSADGRYVAFGSAASNLVSGDTNGVFDVFVRDRLLGTTELISLTDTGKQGDGASAYPCISGNGRYVVYQSSARNMITGRFFGSWTQIFLRDRQLGTTELVTKDPTSSIFAGFGMSSEATITPDGHFVAFTSSAANLGPSDTNGVDDIYLWDRQSGNMELVSLSSEGWQGEWSSAHGSISWDGRYVTWGSVSSRFASDDTNRASDVFVRDRTTGLTSRVSLNWSGEQSQGSSLYPTISADGRYVEYWSYSADLVPDDTNVCQDIFVRELDPPLATVSGTMQFEGLAPAGVPPASVEVETRWNGFTLGAWPVAVGATGSFQTLAPMWAMDMAIKPSHWLRRTLAVDATQGDVSGLVFDFINGDASGDNKVGLTDLGQVLLKFGTTDFMADLDNNGAVGLSDLGIVLLNFGAKGAP